MAPAAIPARVATIKLKYGFQLNTTTNNAQALPPVAKLPSQVMSAKSNIRKVMYTPNAKMAQNNPWDIAPNIESSMESNIFIFASFLQIVYVILPIFIYLSLTHPSRRQ